MRRYMKTAYMLIWRFHFIAALLFLFLTNSSQAQDGEARVPFLFSEDEKLDQTELEKAIPKSSELQGDRYLNDPMTRMEYMLSRLEGKLDTNQDFIRGRLSDGFTYSRSDTAMPLSIQSFARYSRETGRITVGYTIQLSGRPKKPMRTTCESLLTHLGIAAPQANSGYLMHNTMLGVLA